MDNKGRTENDMEKEYWQDVENKVLDKEYLKSEFQEGDLQFDISSVSKNRRDFLKIMGFSFTAMPLTSCLRIPVKKAIPYLEKSESVIPGVATWYSTSMDPSLGEALLVKTREGRPVKIEGNPASPHFRGGTSGVTQASLLSLYDSSRKSSPKLNGVATSFAALDQSLQAAFAEAQNKGKKIYLYTEAISSPSTLALIAELKTKYSNLEHVVYGAHTLSSQLQANKATFGQPVYPIYDMEKADLVLGLSADFLGSWGSSVEFTKQYTSARDILLRKDILKHVQVESIMSLTGSNADVRLTLSPESERALLLGLVSFVQRKKGEQILPAGIQLPAIDVDLVTKIGQELWDKRGKSLVLSGSSLTADQVMVNTLNFLLGNYGQTLKIVKNPYFKGPNDQLVEESFKELRNGRVGGMVFWDCNPLYSYPKATELAEDFKKASFVACLNSFPNETSANCSHYFPTHFYLESWSDYYKEPGILSFSQPVISPLFETRMFQETLLTLLGKSDYYQYLKNFVAKEFFPRQDKVLSAIDFWDRGIHDGIVQLKSEGREANFVSDSLAKSLSRCLAMKDSGNFTLVAYQKIGIRDGYLINNPWLQELPDPITKITWDNYALINPKVARSMGLKTGSMVELSVSGKKVAIPVVLQPGMSERTIGVAVGYGRKVCGKVGVDVGVNVYEMMSFNGETFDQSVSGVTIQSLNKDYQLAQTQTHFSMEGRNIVRETSVKEYLKNKNAGNEESVKLINLWSGHDQKGEQWAMAIDLSKCTGCSGCIVSCNAENNVPVVGKTEVALRREMHWLRIDRYYKGDENQPEVVHQPVMCQHCDNAPCESVCPVLATVQSSDGLNQQVYNRCVGTRYCANNCPYKVRRFNWFDYPHEDKYQNMVLNPDVVVRSRGVMEKCSMCIQRIQEGRLSAKKEGRALQDGEVKLACQQSCPGDAIIFGDLNDPNSHVSKMLNHPRNYHLLEEINVRPRVSYLTKVRNKD